MCSRPQKRYLMWVIIIILCTLTRTFWLVGILIPVDGCSVFDVRVVHGNSFLFLTPLKSSKGM